MSNGFAAALKPDKFTGTYFKRWQTKTTLWLTAMNVFWVAGVPSTTTIAPKQEKTFREATVVFLGAVLSVIGDKLVDAYLHVWVAEDLWEALESKFGATDAGSEMYVMEQFLRQAPKQWHEKFNTTLASVGFIVNEADKCVYYRHGGGEGVILCLYVDDILIFGTNLKVIEEVKSFLY